MNNAILHELNKENPRILRRLHDALGFDFEKPVHVFRIESAFTIPQLWKKSGLKSNEYRSVVLLQSDLHGWSRDELKAVWITGNGTNDFNINLPRRGYYLDTYFRKSDFNDERKSPSRAYFIAQVVTDLVPKKEKPPAELWKRYETNPSRSSCWGGSAHRGYYEIDKSGYPVEMKRDELKQAALRLRNQRQKERAAETDFTAEMEATRSAFEAFRAEILTVLPTASGNVLSATSYAVQKLHWIEIDLTSAERRTREKKWFSVESARNEWDRIAGKIAEYRENLRAAVTPSEEKTA